MSDLLVKLYDSAYDFSRRTELPEITVKRAFVGDRAKILAFVRENFESPNWEHECEMALMQSPPACFVAVHEKEIVGFACTDTSAKGFFGPTGVKESFRKHGVGKELLFRSLCSMKEGGYAYAIIGWAAEKALHFYKEAAGTVEIPDSPPEKSVYSNIAANSGGAAKRGGRLSSVLGVAFDCPDANALCDFYEKLSGWRKEIEDQSWAALRAPEGFLLVFQTVPGYKPPVWPWKDGEQQQMAHIDFRVEDLAAAEALALKHGAKKAGTQHYDTSTVMLDPAGHPFCLSTVAQ